jgi:exosome complex component RRP45
MPREIDPPTLQKEFILAALAEGKRTDGRALLQTRNVEYTFGSELGWVECRLGKTRYAIRLLSKLIDQGYCADTCRYGQA